MLRQDKEFLQVAALAIMITAGVIGGLVLVVYVALHTPTSTPYLNERGRGGDRHHHTPRIPR